MIRAGSVVLHMTSTTGSDAAPYGFGVVCRCGWASPDAYDSRQSARRAGDAHLAEANGAPS